MEITRADSLADGRSRVLQQETKAPTLPQRDQTKPFIKLLGYQDFVC